MRILMLDNEFPPLGGGMGTANLALLERYAQLPDVEVDLITAALGGRWEREQFGARIRLYKVPVWNRNLHHSSNRELVLYTVQALLLALWLQARRRYAVCLAWSTVPAGAVALLLRWLARLPYAVWVSGPDIPGFEQRYTRLYPVLLPLLRRVWRSAGVVIAKCEEEITMIRAVDTQSRVELIPNGVDLEQFQPKLFHPSADPLKLICVGRLIERKGQVQLFQAVHRLAQEGLPVHLSLVGTGDALEAYQRQVTQLGIQEQVQFVGYVPRARIAAAYAAADVFVLPSFNEGMSIAALEAMASGLPVVLTRTGGTDELVEDGLNGYAFNWGDVDTLVAILRRLCLERVRLPEMGLASRHRSLAYGWDRIADRFLTTLTETKVGERFPSRTLTISGRLRRMNVYKMIAPDFPLGRLLIAGKGLLDTGVMLVRHPSAESVRVARLLLAVKPRYTMVRNAHLRALRRLVQTINREGLAGDIVECGVWNGGSAAIMMRTHGERTTHPARRIWLFDSFQGLPKPGDKDGAKENTAYFEGWCRGDVANVRAAFRRLRLPWDAVQIVQGWFEDTVPQADIPAIALLHIDADWYDSVKLVLDAFYDKVVPGGYIFFDDFNYWSGCNRAVEDFMRERALDATSLHVIGKSGAYLHKPRVVR